MRGIIITVGALLLSMASSAQGIVPNGYVDFHIHSILKNYYRNVSHPRDTPTFASKPLLNWTPYPGKGTPADFNKLSSPDQGTYIDLQGSNASILCMSLYTLEKQSISDENLAFTGFLATNRRIRDILARTPLGILDDLVSLRSINASQVTGISKSRQATAFDPALSNFKELLGQLRLVEAQAPSIAGARRVLLAKERSDLDQTDAIRLVLTVEGAHNFYGDSLSAIDDIKGHEITEEQLNEMLGNLRYVKEKYRLFFVTPAHLFENKVVGGARGLDVDNKLFRNVLARIMWDPRFALVDGKDIAGINYRHQPLLQGKITCDSCRGCTCLPDNSRPVTYTNAGMKFLLATLEPNTQHKRTYIDMRHMDVLARKQFIGLVSIQKMFNPFESIPLIVSHAAVSGKPLKMAEYLGLCPRFDDYQEFTPRKIKKYYRKWAELCEKKMGMQKDEVSRHLTTAGWFHPMSNNLYDEEIRAVYESGGIIGITMEERALGKGAFNYQVNSSTKNQLRQYFERRKYASRLSKQDRDNLLYDLEVAEPFVRNLFYIVEHSGQVDSDKQRGTIESWKHVAIGSDYDGIMNPLDCAPRSSDIPAFYRFLCAHLDFYAAYLGKSDLLLSQTPETLMKRLFFENGEAFIKKYF